MRAVALAAHPLGNGLRLPVHAPHRRHDPQFVADAHLPVAAQVALYRDVALRNVERIDPRRIGVGEVVVQVGFQVVRMDPRPGRHAAGDMPDRIAVLDDVLPLGEIPQGEFMSPGHRLTQRYHPAVDLHTLARSEIGQRHGHVVRGIDFQESFHKLLWSEKSGAGPSVIRLPARPLRLFGKNAISSKICPARPSCPAPRCHPHSPQRPPRSPEPPRNPP